MIFKMKQTNTIKELIIRLGSIAYRFIRNKNITWKGPDIVLKKINICLYII